VGNVRPERRHLSSTIREADASQRSWRHIVAHSASCGLGIEATQARERGRHKCLLTNKGMRVGGPLCRPPTRAFSFSSGTHGLRCGLNYATGSAGWAPAPRTPAENVEIPGEGGASARKSGEAATNGSVSNQAHYRLRGFLLSRPFEWYDLKRDKSKMPPITKHDQASVAIDRDGLLALLRSWTEDKSGYDDRAWPILQKAIEENRLSSRKRFAESHFDEPTLGG
jgi:hypothetical protein